MADFNDVKPGDMFIKNYTASLPVHAVVIQVESENTRGDATRILCYSRGPDQRYFMTLDKKQFIRVQEYFVPCEKVVGASIEVLEDALNQLTLPVYSGQSTQKLGLSGNSKELVGRIEDLAQSLYLENLCHSRI